MQEARVMELVEQGACALKNTIDQERRDMAEKMAVRVGVMGHMSLLIRPALIHVNPMVEKPATAEIPVMPIDILTKPKKS